MDLEVDMPEITGMKLVTLEGEGGYEGLVLHLFEDRTGQMLGWITPIVPPQPDPITG